jgi:hypothetical protein
LLVSISWPFSSDTAVLAAPVSLEPDDFPEGTDLRSMVPGVLLSVVGSPQSQVQAVSGFEEIPHRNFASTGSLVFGRVPSLSNVVPQGWDDRLGILRIDFPNGASFVQVDMIYDDYDISQMLAFDSSDNLVGSFIPGFAEAQIFHGVIGRPQADIAYVTVGGINAEGILLDHLVFETVPEPATPLLLLTALLAFVVISKRAAKNVAAGSSKT